MMIGGGSLANMNAKIRENLAMRRKRSYFRDKKKEMVGEALQRREKRRNETSSEELKKIERRVSRLIEKDRKRSRVALVITVLILVLSFVLILSL